MPESDSKGEIITTYELLERSTQAGIELQRGDGSFPPSRNGIYYEPETPVRTTSHWLTTISKIYRLTGDETFAEAANSAADYLLSDEARPYSYTFHSRKSNGKDKCDGLVGQAAPIRGLYNAGSILNRPELIDKAVEIYNLHAFNEQLGLWEAIDIDGKRLSFDRTMNHQILFASASSLLSEQSDQVKNQVKSFLDLLGKNIGTYPDGLVKHYIRPPLTTVMKTFINSSWDLTLLWNEIASRYQALSSEFRTKELGYQLTVLRGLAHLKRRHSDHKVWNHPHITSALDYIQTSDFKRHVKDPKSKFGSMTPGIDYAIVLSSFNVESDIEIRQWIELEIDRKYDQESQLLTRNSSDPMFQAAKIGSLLNIPNIKISLNPN